MRLANNIRYLRRKHNYSQDFIAEKLGYKSYTTIQKWEMGIAEPSLAKLKEFADIFSVNIDDLTNKDLEMEYSSFDSPEHSDLKSAIRLKKAFETSGFSQAELCEKAGITKGALSSYLSGRYAPKQKTLEALAKALGVSVFYLMGLEDENSSEKGVKVPVLGEVPAGIPLEAIEDIIDYEEIPQEMAKTGEFFALRIKGESMSPRILDGDVVIVRKQDDAETGDIVIVLVNGSSATCKRLVKNNEGISLISFNPAYTPMFYTKEDVFILPIRILGKVVELRGKF